MSVSPSFFFLPPSFLKGRGSGACTERSERGEVNHHSLTSFEKGIKLISMYCAKCGAQIVEGSSFCGKCGAAVPPPAAPSVSTATPSSAATAPAQPTTAGTRTSGLAVASLVLGIVGIFLNFLSILAIIFGGIAISQTSKNPDLKGKGLAIAGLVLGILVAISWIALIAFGSVFWWFS